MITLREDLDSCQLQLASVELLHSVAHTPIFPNTTLKLGERRKREEEGLKQT